MTCFQATAVCAMDLNVTNGLNSTVPGRMKHIPAFLNLALYANVKRVNRHCGCPQHLAAAASVPVKRSKLAGRLNLPIHSSAARSKRCPWEPLSIRRQGGT